MSSPTNKGKKKRKSDSAGESLLSQVAKKFKNRGKTVREQAETTGDISRFKKIKERNSNLTAYISNITAKLKSPLLTKKEKPIKIKKQYVPTPTPSASTEISLASKTSSKLETASHKEIKAREEKKPSSDSIEIKEIKAHSSTFESTSLINKESVIKRLSTIPEMKAEKPRVKKEDAAVNTGHDLAIEIARHVETLRKISVIADEFNKKTAKNLKEIIDSVKLDLIQKLNEINATQPTTSAENMSLKMETISSHD